MAVLRLKSVWLTLAVLVACGLLGCDAVQRVIDSAQAQQLTKKCFDESNQRHLDDALRDCNAAVEAGPTYATAYLYRAYVYRLLGNVQKEIADLNKAIELYPNFAQAYALRCEAALSLPKADFRSAGSDCDQAYRLGPQDLLVLQSIYTLHIAEKNYKSALSDGSRVIGLEPGDASGYLMQCQVYYTTGRLAQAHRTCDYAEHASEDSQNAYDAEVVSATNVLDWKRALFVADRAVAASHSAIAYNNRCWVRQRVNQMSGAQADCAKAVQLSGGEPNVRDTRGELLIRLGHYGEALSDENAAIARYPNLAFSWGHRCIAEEHMGDHMRAWSDCSKAIAINPKDGEWYTYRGDIYLDRGDFARARADFEKARSLNKYAAEAYREQAILELRADNATVARMLAGAYVAKNPYDPLGHEIYGKALMLTGNTTGAATELNLALQGYRERGDAKATSEMETSLASLKRSSAR